VDAVALGGSRAQATNRPDSNWDLAVYYRDGFDPQTVRDLGWPGQLTDLGGWGRVFNGGGKLTTVEEQLIDVHYRDLGLIDEIHDDALRGEFTIEPLLFHQAGLPSYILLAELGINMTLRGQVPQWDYPKALRESAPGIWWDQADHTLHYANGHARHGRVAQCAGLLSEAACHAGHAILAHRGEWITNEKQLLDKAGLRRIDDIVAQLDTEADSLSQAVDDARALLLGAVEEERFPWRSR
jgi:hypothetical protein